jgi:hypothetical protein
MSLTDNILNKRRRRAVNRTIKRRDAAAAIAAVIAMLVAPAAVADAVTDWNFKTSTVVTAAGGGPLQARVNAMVQIAVHDALNAIEPRFASHNHVGAFNPNASPEAALARATRDVLLGTLPASQHAAINTMYVNYIAGLACAPAQPSCISDGEAAGAAAAAAMLDERHLDGSENPHRPYTLAPGPGVYQATLPLPTSGPPIQLGGWGDVKTFALGNAAQFLPGNAKMLDVTSAEYAIDYNEVKSLGSFAVRSAAPDSEESRIARFWPNGGRDYNAIARTIVAPLSDRTLWDNARLFALVNMATADASVATFNVKYHYNFWRPVTAIRWGEEGNPATDHDPSDASWSSYITTPPYPDYTCGLPTLVGASTGMLREYFGTDAIAFSHTASGMSRDFASLSQASAEAASARVYGGIHFRTGCVRAVEQAEDVASFIFNTQLRPLHP